MQPPDSLYPVRVLAHGHVTRNRQPAELHVSSQSEWLPALLPFGNGYPHAVGSAQQYDGHDAMRQSSDLLFPGSFAESEKRFMHDNFDFVAAPKGSVQQPQAQGKIKRTPTVAMRNPLHQDSAGMREFVQLL